MTAAPFSLMTLAQRRHLARVVSAARRALGADGHDPADDDRAYRQWAAPFLARFADAHAIPPAVADLPAGDAGPAVAACLDELPPALFECVDAAGWMRQYWQSALRRRGGKVGPERIGAVTQLFTEPYMAQFLLDNSLGAWWAARRLPARLLQTATDEAALRRAAALPGLPLGYLRWLREDGRWRPAAGYFPAWPDSASSLRVLDPCCGGGIFLILALPMLAAIIADQEKLDQSRAAGRAARCLFGLDIDPQCGRITSLGLAAALARLGAPPECAGAPTVCVPQPAAVGAEAEAFATLGSLYRPGGDVAPATPALDMLRGGFHLVATNTPYLGRGKQDAALAAYCRRHYPEADRDLATVFLRRAGELCGEGGVAALVLPQNWLYLQSYRKLRTLQLRDSHWRLLARLGEGGFHDADAAGAFSLLFIASRNRPPAAASVTTLDAAFPRGPDRKASLLRESPLTSVAQSTMAAGQPGGAATAEGGVRLETVATSRVGVQTGDDARYLRYFWEFPSLVPPWRYIQGTPDPRQEFSGLSEVIRWDDGLRSARGARIQGLEAVGGPGVAVHRLRTVFAHRYSGELFHQNIAVLSPHDHRLMPALWCYTSSPAYAEALRRLDGKLNITNATLGKPVFDPAAWARAAARAYPSGLPLPYSNHPAQWIFHGHPVKTCCWDAARSEVVRGPDRWDDITLQVAAARVLGYAWPAEHDSGMTLAPVQRALAAESAGLPAAAEPVLTLAALASRLREMLAAAGGKRWSTQRESELVAGTGLERWLRNRFFAGHCRLFRHRPFLWHMWDGLPRGFSVVANYHALDNAGLRGVIAMLEKHLQASAGRRELTAGKRLAHGLTAILDGTPPCDLFVRWKPAGMQPQGWRPCLDDGVRLNLRPVLLAPDVKIVGAGVLRHRPMLKYSPDRGLDGPDSPWHGEFHGLRRNDHHPRSADNS